MELQMIISEIFAELDKMSKPAINNFYIDWKEELERRQVSDSEKIEKLMSKIINIAIHRAERREQKKA